MRGGCVICKGKIGFEEKAPMTGSSDPDILIRFQERLEAWGRIFCSCIKAEYRTEYLKYFVWSNSKQGRVGGIFWASIIQCQSKTTKYNRLDFDTIPGKDSQRKSFIRFKANINRKLFPGKYSKRQNIKDKIYTRRVISDSREGRPLPGTGGWIFWTSIIRH